MDDLDVIRLAVVDIIPRERIARARRDVKQKFRGGQGRVSLGRGSSFAGGFSFRLPQ